MQMYDYHAVTIPGAEALLCDELRELGFKSVRFNKGGIPFRGEKVDGWRACLESRLAQRIQMLVGRFACPDEDALYQGVYDLPWGEFITANQTIAVQAVVRGSKLTHSAFAALKVKDAIVDQIREQTGQRPSVDREDPDVRINLYLANDKATVYLDLAGIPMHRRGYRAASGPAPLRETLAAVMVRLSGWDCKTPFIDPMCGSGTLVIEAAMLAANIAPGLLRDKFGFERWANFSEEDVATLRQLRGKLHAAKKDVRTRILASDVDTEVLMLARRNARLAGVKINFKRVSINDLQEGEIPGTMITNPPYGMRIGRSEDLPRQVAKRVSRLHGWRVCIMDGEKEYQKLISQPTKEVYKLKNGDLDCNYLLYDMP